jgi:hypothetical protein
VLGEDFAWPKGRLEVQQSVTGKDLSYPVSVMVVDLEV